jgi:hypothetical protein
MFGSLFGWINYISLLMRNKSGGVSGSASVIASSLTDGAASTSCSSSVIASSLVSKSSVVGASVEITFYLWDLFVDQNDTPVDMHIPDVGPEGWTVIAFDGDGSDFQIQDNTATIVVTTDTNVVCVSDAGSANHTVMVTFTLEDSKGGAVYAVSRWGDSNNYFIASANTTENQLQLIKVADGEATNLASPWPTIPTLTTGVIYTIILYTTATTVRATLSGEDIETLDTGTVSDSDLSSNTSFGTGMRRFASGSYFQSNITTFTVY